MELQLLTGLEDIVLLQLFRLLRIDFAEWCIKGHQGQDSLRDQVHQRFPGRRHQWELLPGAAVAWLKQESSHLHEVLDCILRKMSDWTRRQLAKLQLLTAWGYIMVQQPLLLLPDVLAGDPPPKEKPLLPMLSLLSSWGWLSRRVRVEATRVILGRAEGCSAQQELTRVDRAEGQLSGMGRLYPFATCTHLSLLQPCKQTWQQDFHQLQFASRPVDRSQHGPWPPQQCSKVVD